VGDQSATVSFACGCAVGRHRAPRMAVSTERRSGGAGTAADVAGHWRPPRDVSLDKAAPISRPRCRLRQMGRVESRRRPSPLPAPTAIRGSPLARQ
jgi:hypothetical protein